MVLYWWKEVKSFVDEIHPLVAHLYGWNLVLWTDEKRGSWMKLDELLPSLRLLPSSCTSCTGLLLLLSRVSRIAWQFSLARSLPLWRVEISRSQLDDYSTQFVVITCNSIFLYNSSSLIFKSTEKLLQRRKQTERQRDRRNGKFRVLCVHWAVDGGNGGKMGPVLACSATGVALPESISWRMDGGETVPSSAVPGCALRY